ncbi:MAG: hypothetical protein ACOC5B_00800 [Myxococcota bacterium]
MARPGDKKVLVVLTACLRLAQVISGLHRGAIRDVDVRVADDQVEVEVTADHQPLIELWEARKHEGLFERTFGRRLILRGRVPG